MRIGQINGEGFTNALPGLNRPVRVPSSGRHYNQNCAEYGWQFSRSEEASCGNAAAQNSAKCAVNRRTRSSLTGWAMSSGKPLGSGANTILDMTRPSTLL